MIQILHRGTTCIDSGHQFTVSTADCKDGRLLVRKFVYRFRFTGKRQICAILKPEGSQLHFLNCLVQNQIGDADCVLFAIAFAVAICLGMIDR